MFSQSLQINTVFIGIILLMVGIAYVIGELWIHGKALFLFPRYYQNWCLSQNDTYELAPYEKQILRKFGRMIVMISTIIVLIMAVIFLMTQRIHFIYAMALLIFAILVLLYHYHRSYRD